VIGADTLPAGDYTLGLRAETITVAPAGHGHADGTVDVLERLGERTLVYTRLASDAGNSRIKVGDRTGLVFDGAKSHLFDAAGRAWHGREAGDG
jgi:multiple sugar transport system ATP-binding protein